jgi:hypothetical protein
VLEGENAARDGLLDEFDVVRSAKCGCELDAVCICGRTPRR